MVHSDQSRARCTEFRATMNVVLGRGRGKKAEYNGRDAQVVARRGGWADAKLKCGVELKWRSGHWLLASDDDLLSRLSEDLLVHIAQQLPTPDVCAFLVSCRRFSSLRLRPCFSECHLRAGLPRGYGVVPSKQLDFVRHLAATRASLRSLHVDIGAQELAVLFYLLRECETSALASVNISFRGPVSQMRLALLPATITVGGPTTFAQLHAAVIAEFVAAVPGLELGKTLTKQLAQHCPALTSLSHRGEIEDVVSLGAIKTLRRLESSFGEADDVGYVLEELPNLTHLVLTGGTSSALHGGRLDLQSASLVSIDMSNSAKGLTFERIECPALREIRCSDYSNYGNGLLVATSDRRILNSYDDTDLDDAELTQECTFVRIQEGSWMPKQEAPASIMLNDNCVISWQQCRVRREPDHVLQVTPATTLQEFVNHDYWKGLREARDACHRHCAAQGV